jgi:diketogulonate reductase-like aldo/keto reductase
MAVSFFGNPISYEIGGNRHFKFQLRMGHCRGGLSDTDWDIWHAMEELKRRGKTRMLGISNVDIAQLEELYAHAAIKPALVQNRCFASRGWDREVRLFCHAHGMAYHSMIKFLKASSLMFNAKHESISHLL